MSEEQKILREAQKPIPQFVTNYVYSAGRRSPVLYYVHQTKTAFCTACRSEITCTKRPYPSKTVCPICKTTVRVEGVLKTQSHTRRSKNEDHFFVRRFGNGLICLGVHVDYEEWYDEKAQKIQVYRGALCYRAIVNDGIRIRAYNLKSGRPVRTDVRYPPFHSSYAFYVPWRTEYSMHGWMDRAWATAMRHKNPHFHSVPDPTDMNDIMRYDRIAELLKKNGFNNLLRDYLNGKAPSLRKTATSKEKLFGLSGAEIRIAQKHDFSDPEIKRLQELRKTSGYVPKEELVVLGSMLKCINPTRRVQSRIPELSMSDLARVVAKYGVDAYATFYADYIDAVVKIPGMKLMRSVLFPENLETAHDKAIAQVRAIKNAPFDEKIRARAAELNDLIFAESKWIVSVPKNCEDIIREGKILSHCVERYVDRVASGETTIVFVRKADAPETPYVTVECDKKGRHIIQARGQKNAAPDEETNAFMERWIHRTIRRTRAKKQRISAGISA